MTAILTLPPSQVASVATQWLKVIPGVTAPDGMLMTGLSRKRTPASMSVMQSPRFWLSSTKAAMPGSLSGKLPTTAQSGVSKVAGLTTSRVPTVQLPRPASQSWKWKLDEPLPPQMAGALGSSSGVKPQKVGGVRSSTAAAASATSVQSAAPITSADTVPVGL